MVAGHCSAEGHAQRGAVPLPFLAEAAHSFCGLCVATMSALTSRSETVPSHRVSMMGGTQTTGSVTGGTARSCRERSTSSGTSDSSAVHFVLTRASSTEDGDAANEADGKAVEAEAEAARAAEAAEAAMLGRRLPVASWLLNAWSSSASIDAG